MVSQIIPWLEEDQDKHSHLIGVTIGFVCMLDSGPASRKVTSVS